MRRVAGHIAHQSHQGKVGCIVGDFGLGGQNDGGLRQIGQPAERKAAVAKSSKVGHCQEMREARDVDGRVGLHGAAHVV